MGVLRARVDGSWVDIGGGADEVSVGPDTPTDPNVELWYDSDDPGGVAFTQREGGTWTPVFTGFVPGTGAVVDARYLWLGGLSVGDAGLLTLQVRIILGTGFTAWTTGHRMSFPPGFAFSPAFHGGSDQTTYEDASTGARYYGRASIISATVMSMGCFAVSGSFIQDSVLSATVPFVWAAADRYHIKLSGQAVRI